MLFSESQSLDSLSFVITISINKIVLKKNDLIYFEKAITAKPRKIHWVIDGELLAAIQSAHEGKLFESDICDRI